MKNLAAIALLTQFRGRPPLVFRITLDRALLRTWGAKHAHNDPDTSVPPAIESEDAQ